jgi:hypothetical protein
VPRTPKDFSDFKPPWGDDPDSIDPDQLARLIHSLRVSEDEKTAEIRTLKTENQELADANDVFKAASEEASKEHSTEVQKAVAAAEKERDQAKEELAKVKHESDLKEVRIQFPALEEKDLDRLKGDTLEELLEDAEEFAARIAPPADPDDDGNDDDEDLRNGIRRQPRVKTPGDPKGGEPRATDVDTYLNEKAQQSSWVS